MVKNIVLVHGAFADGSSWNKVIRLLQAMDYNVTAVQARVMAAVQMPWKVPESKMSSPAWRSRPSWYQISEQDKMINPKLQHFMAKRMGATTVSLDASHASAVSHPQEIAALIVTAAGSAATNDAAA